MVDPSEASALVSITDSVALITLNRPDRMNAFDARLHADLRAVLDIVEQDSAIAAVVITGAGPAFCAGQDLKERAAAFERGTPPDLGASLEENYNPLIHRLASLPYPVISAVNGVASGAGAALAIACDIVLAARSATFQFGFARVALGPDSGTSWTLPRRIGPGRARALALTGDAVGSAEALAIGLCDRIAEDAELLPRALALASALASGPGETFTLIKKMMQHDGRGTLGAALATEADAQRTLGRHPNYREAVTAFAAKRKPEFR